MSSHQPRFSQGADEAKLTASLDPLLSSSGGRWALTKEGEALERTFRFKTFGKTWVSTLPSTETPDSCITS